MKKLIFSFFSRFKKEVFLTAFFLIIISIAVKTYHKSIDKEENEVVDELTSEKLLIEEEPDEMVSTDGSTNNEIEEIIESAPKEVAKNKPKPVSSSIKPAVKKPVDVISNPQPLKQNAIDTIMELHDGLKKINTENFRNYEEIIQLIKSTYDVEKMTAMIIGNVWKKISTEKQREMLLVFEEYIAKIYIKRFIKIKKLDFENGEKKKSRKQLYDGKNKINI